MEHFKNILIIAFIVISSACSNPYHNENNVKDSIKDDSVYKIDTIEKETNIIYPKFNVIEYCNSEDQEEVYVDMGKYGKQKPYEIELKLRSDTLSISYKIIDDCCLKFKGKVNLEDDKLNLFHENRANEVCECNCMYEFNFQINHIDSVPEKIFINNEKQNL